ncbi:hypothetical protein BDW71DRAFT_217084 [Aspergillus fruticulosus]
MATRRSHKKSRNGCNGCKRRRIKCDEAHPCLNCSKRGMNCTFEQRPSNTPPGRISDSTGAPCRRPSSEDPFRAFNDRLSEGTWFSQEWTGQDPELMHHYTLYTSKTLARRPHMQETWQVPIPEIAYSYEFLMHGILGMSALHLACLKPERYSDYLAGAGFHMSLGLRLYRKVLLSPSPDNCYALFSFSSLIMLYIYASPTASLESHAANGLESIVELLKLCRGTLVLLPYFDQIRQSSLKHLFMRGFAMDNGNTLTDRTTLFEGLTPHLNSLQPLIISEIPDDTERATFLQALDRLKASFTSIENATPPLECGMLYMWPLAVEDQFFDFLRQQHPVALVLLAFYCAQLRAFEDYWFVGRQGAVWLGHVEAVLERRLNEWLLWPRAVFSE